MKRDEAKKRNAMEPFVKVKASVPMMRSHYDISAFSFCTKLVSARHVHQLVSGLLSVILLLELMFFILLSWCYTNFYGSLKVMSISVLRSDNTK